jgi:regulatory protein
LPRRGPDAFEAALGALRRRERASDELAAWLRERGHPDDEIAAALERLAVAGELDDERFARRYAEDKRELRGWGPERIREALRARGLPPDLVARALDGESREAEIERASALLRRRGRPLADDADRARALAFLTRRGYDYEAAYEAVRTAATAAG